MSITSPRRAESSERLRIFQLRLQSLRGPYAAQLPTALAGIAAYWSEIEAADGGGERLASFYEAIHRLAGTAGAYGFAEVSRHAAAIDTVVGRARREARSLTAADLVTVRRALAELVTAIAGTGADRSLGR